VAGASVVLLDGRLAAWLSRSDSSLLLFPDPDRGEMGAARAVADALAACIASRRRGGLRLEQIDGVGATGAPVADAFLQAGFRPSGGGLLFRV
jgi:hypothetical protein